MLTIISSSVGGALVVIIISLVAVICRKSQTRKKRYENHRSISKDEDYQDLNTSQMLAIPRVNFPSASSLNIQETILDNPAYRHDYKNAPDSR